MSTVMDRVEEVRKNLTDRLEEVRGRVGVKGGGLLGGGLLGKSNLGQFPILEDVRSRIQTRLKGQKLLGGSPAKAPEGILEKTAREFNPHWRPPEVPPERRRFA